MTAWLALEGEFYARHTAVQTAVQRDLVKPGRVGVDFGQSYDLLMDLRHVGDYGGERHVTEQAMPKTFPSSGVRGSIPPAGICAAVKPPDSGIPGNQRR